MNESDVQRAPQGGAPAQHQTPSSKQSAAAATANAESESGAEPSDHVCTDACAHEGARKGKSTSPAVPSAAKAVPITVKNGNESPARRS